MAAVPTNLDKLFRTPVFGSYDNVLATHLTNKTTRQGFDMDNLGMMDVKDFNYVFSEYNKKYLKLNWYVSIQYEIDYGVGS